MNFSHEILMAQGIASSPEIQELQAALAKAQGALHNATKQSANPFFNSKYADLAAVWDVARAVLSSNGLSVIQMPVARNGEVIVVTRLGHSSGQWIQSSLTMKPTKPDPQGIGSAITYARRYALAAMCGIAQEDDDGNAASRPVNDSGSKKKAMATDAQVGKMRAELKRKGITPKALQAEFGTGSLDEIPMDKVTDVLKWAGNHAA